MLAKNNPEKWREYNTRSYAKKLGITVEELEARRAAAIAQREQRRLNPVRRKKVKSAVPKKPKTLSPRELFHERLKKKHAKWKGTRLEKSIKPPIFLEWPEDGDGRRNNGRNV